ncbi:hypothetical protein BpHYR1_025494, partial [Brachionus plicatilis]
NLRKKSKIIKKAKRFLSNFIIHIEFQKKYPNFLIKIKRSKYKLEKINFFKSNYFYMSCQYE